MDGIVMPLHEYINHHVAMGIDHNGATFQKTTKNLQQCLQMWLVHKLFLSYWNQLYIIIMHHQIPSSFNSSIDTINDQDNSSSIIESKSENMTVGKLMETYETCISTLRSSQSQRRIASLKRISPANFTKEKQHQIMEQKVHDSVTPGFNCRRSGRGCLPTLIHGHLFIYSVSHSCLSLFASIKVKKRRISNIKL